MVKTNKLIWFLSLTSLALSACETSAQSFVRKLYKEDFSSGKTFITFADMPPSPDSPSELADYKALGFNTCLLTEDHVTMVNEEGHLSEEYKQAIRNIGEAGLSCWIRNMYNDADYFVCSEEESKKERSNYGTPYSLSPRNITTEFQEFDDIITGFYMGDECYENTEDPVEHGEIPSSAPYRYSAFDQYDKIVEWFNTYYPDKIYHMNQVPSSSINHWTIGDTYQSFIENYVDTILDEITDASEKTICLDNYPYLEKSPEKITDSFLTDHLTCAIINRDYNALSTTENKANFGFCVQLHQFSSSSGNSTIAPRSAEDITYILYSGLSMGAKTIEYFCYGSLAGNVEGVVSTDGTKNDTYYYTKEANERVLPLQDVLLDFTWQNYYALSAEKEEDRENEFAFDNIKSMTSSRSMGSLATASCSSRLDTSIGYFTKGNQDAYMVVNQSAPVLGQTNTVFLSFNGCNQALVYHEDSVEFVKLINGQIRLNLTPGDAYFIIPA